MSRPSKKKQPQSEREATGTDLGEHLSHVINLQKLYLAKKKKKSL